METSEVIVASLEGKNRKAGFVESGYCCGPHTAGMGGCCRCVAGSGEPLWGDRGGLEDSSLKPMGVTAGGNAIGSRICSPPAAGPVLQLLGPGRREEELHRLGGRVVEPVLWEMELVTTATREASGTGLGRGRNRERRRRIKAAIVGSGDSRGSVLAAAVRKSLVEDGLEAPMAVKTPRCMGDSGWNNLMRTTRRLCHRKLHGMKNSLRKLLPFHVASRDWFDRIAVLVAAQMAGSLQVAGVLLQERWLADAAVSADSEDAVDVELSRVELL
ncbi:hypothetical protein MLD38_028535 [Melastoma candidum]|uniref:Uncharacterized protein n=1 Tax=Melastoma candidum TaxID=119954 RepID=A0ACB9N136_9MYRT|nr:hypothetical protein MLD38_028535 [Melastoma candidum]